MQAEWTLPPELPRRRLPAGTALFHEGEVGEHMYLVVDGRLQVSKQVVASADKVLSVLGPGQFVGEMSLLTGAKRSATVTALTDSEVAEIDREAFVQLLHDQPQAGLELMRQMAQRLEETNEELVLTALEAALMQRRPQRLQPAPQRLRFVATGSFAAEKAGEVLRLAGEHAASGQHPAIVASLWRPGRVQDALIYIVETDNPRDLLELVWPFAGLVHWDITPALDVQALAPAAAPKEEARPAPFLLP
ncbi:MAG: hypothetical protein KatS3mg131_2455 [Candidatus Tectimicrobiota bacterium]|nr:MAG: hypothetical protein KatS3mg131_2455 [Candidatus Tectomicrobia bacterium]